MILRTILSTLLFVSIVFPVSSQSVQIKPGSLVRYTEEDGVPAAEVSDIIQDQSGFIWLGTINGLSRFDGYEFKRFYTNPNDEGSIQGMIVWSLYEDSKGIIWVGASLEHLNAYDPVTKTFRHYPYNHLVNKSENVEIGITTIADNHHGRMYFGVGTIYNDPISNALLYIDNDVKEVKVYEPENGMEINNIGASAVDLSGNTWFVSWSGLLKIDVSGNLEIVKSLDSEFQNSQHFPTDIKCDTEGNIWLITNQYNLIKLNPQTEDYQVFRPAHLPAEYNPWAAVRIAFDSKENIWIGSTTGLGYFDPTQEDFQLPVQTNQLELEQANISALCYDSFGSLWMGTDFRGLYKYEDRAVFQSFSPDQNKSGSLTPGWVNHIIEVSPEKIALTTSTGQNNNSGINILNLPSGEIEAYPFSTYWPSWNHIFGLSRISYNEIFVSTNEGYFSVDLNSLKPKRMNFDGISDEPFITKNLIDQATNHWLATFNGLFKKDSQSNIFNRIDISLGDGANASSNEITNIVESHRGGLWILTHFGLFYYDDEIKQLDRIGHDPEQGDILISQDVKALYEDQDGYIWIGLWQGGLSKINLENNTIKTFTRDDGLPSMSVQSILPDEKNKALWLSTFEGLSRFNLKTEQFNNYSIADGVQSQLFADNSSLISSTGYYFFGGANGINMFRPDEVQGNSLPPKVFLTELKLSGVPIIPGENTILKKPIAETKEITLAHHQNDLMLGFMALHYSNPQKNQCWFMLENYESEWRKAGNQFSATYPNLPPGKYTFRVKAANNNGVWNTNEVQLRITINQPWWKTIYAYMAYFVIFLLAVIITNRILRNRVIRKEREKSRVRELEQAKEIEKAYTTLKATQSQLIQSEKMASLGELTAGIAHEIQNPLNFVNNFSELSVELLDEMDEEMLAGNFEDVKDISGDLKQNLEKINHHGKRADSIVKGMLQHSRSGNEVKELVDINQLADEYLRLSYHGLRAQDKSFNATLETNFDSKIKPVHLVPQDIGRVLLNLFTNAFYAVTEKKQENETEYEPIVAISTCQIKDHIEIRIKDNGDGIPDDVREKIFNPFFTTKPTGKGTGLGLSMSYDIITKGHQGELKMDTQPGQFTEFIIVLPTKPNDNENISS